MQQSIETNFTQKIVAHLQKNDILIHTPRF